MGTFLKVLVSITSIRDREKFKQEQRWTQSKERPNENKKFWEELIRLLYLHNSVCLSVYLSIHPSTHPPIYIGAGLAQAV
jgi:hypothetical protein